MPLTVVSGPVGPSLVHEAHHALAGCFAAVLAEHSPSEWVGERPGTADWVLDGQFERLGA